ncbi:hypothetical protein TELCIR_25026 [Teladorsagia circumcincta]|uniref:Beta-lactamase-related domain-containing protein n=1 Tax=Teladorsagia circumcincta TaxID=45464 RepID=A0A2G9T7U6_TELCI|nr:hypothetical protein TELCIR_25026 [Teladorsagia circumcincta]
MIGHPGHGCQQVMLDTKNKIAFAYVTNGLKLGIYDLCRNYMRLQTALYRILKDLNGMNA